MKKNFKIKKIGDEMKKILFLLILLCSYNVAAGDFEDGNDAYEEKNYTKAILKFESAAKKGNIKAQIKLSNMYFEGKGVPQDYSEAIRWLKLAGEQGDVCIQYELGTVFLLGVGIEEDKVQAARWLKMAAEQGEINAQHILGLMYRDGTGVAQNYEEAVSWFKKAAEQGLGMAQVSLGRMYYEQTGYPQNLVMAHMWFNLGALNETLETEKKEAVKKRDDIALKMTTKQIAEAQNFATKFKTSKPKHKCLIWREKNGNQ